MLFGFFDPFSAYIPHSDLFKRIILIIIFCFHFKNQNSWIEKYFNFSILKMFAEL